MRTAVIIDDESKIQNSLNQIINDFTEGIELIGKAGNVRDGLHLIKNTTPDIVFLDIEMPDGSGFDLLKLLPQLNFSLIFCTAHNEYAVEAFKYSAVDYILKPFEIVDVVKAVERAQNTINLRNKNDSIKQLLNEVSDSKKEKIVLKTSTDVHIVQIDEIYNCESESGYTTFMFKGDKKILVSKNLKEFDYLLNNHDFIKTHQSHMVNMNVIERYHKRDGGYLILSNGREIPISVRKKEAVLSALESKYK
ncbi:MAG: LytTR family DNA-binding domain-containing protein [Bacteroidota bacterium]|nr:LytTR family DNA-binding domain-containing protein [Bacteroidota bacterium]